jgi:general secretion pathway protein K
LTTVKFNDVRRTSSEVVVALGGAEDPYRVLSWQDDVEAGRRPQKLTGF